VETIASSALCRGGIGQEGVSIGTPNRQSRYNAACKLQGNNKKTEDVSESSSVGFDVDRLLSYPCGRF
jgi:hypothetical protein